MEKRKKGTLITIVILMAVFVPLAIGGVFVKLSGYEASSEAISEAPKNPNKSFKFQGLLYFYNEDEKLIGVYKCNYPNEYCDYAYETIDDDLYEIDYYKTENIGKVSLINNKYAFIVDSNTSDSNISLINVTNGELLGTFQKIKNYNIGINENLYIVQNLYGKWGVISLENDLKEVISFDYNFIGLLNKINNKKIESGPFAVIHDQKWLIIDSKKAILSSELTEPIVSFNGKYIITKYDSMYYLYSYQATMMLEATGYRELRFVGKYISVLTMNNELYLVDPETNLEFTPRISVEYGSEYDWGIDSSMIKVTINGITSTYELVE